MTTFQDLIDDVIGHQFSVSRYTDFVKRRLNESQAFITASTNFREMQRTEDGILSLGSGPAFALPADFQRLDTVLYSEALAAAAPFEELERLDGDEFDLLPSQTGRPTAYKVEGSGVTLWPTPDVDASYRIKYFAKPVTLIGANDVPEIPDEYLYLMIERVLQFCFARENDYSAAQYHQGQFESGLARCQNEVHHDTNDRSQPRIVEGF